jgi:uncharacterized protein YbjT (DUF2867 family)
MYAITGATGHVGGAAVRTLLAAGAPVRAVVRDASKGAALGATEVAVADLTDVAALTTAFAGARGAFVMMPTLPSGGDAEYRAIADAIARAVAAAGVPHVVMLSSIGAELAEGNGPIRWLHHLEQALLATGVQLTALRAPFFQDEKVETGLGTAAGGVYPVFAESADVPVPMVATRDIGAAVAAYLTSPPAATEIIELDAPVCTEREVEDRLGARLGTEVTAVAVPRDNWHDVFTSAGLPPQLATELVALYDAAGRGVLRSDSKLRRHPCPTPIEDTVRDIVAHAQGVS